jgi:hypothetical protein
MKNLILALSVILTSSALFAQIKKVDEVNASMSQGSHHGFKVLIPETPKKEVTKKWIRLMKSYETKTAKIKKEDDYLSPDASIPSLGEQSINVYAQFQETPEGTYLTAFFDLGSAYLNGGMHREQAEAAVALLKSFATKTAKESIAEKVKAETKKLEKLEKEQKGLVKDKEGYEKDIKEAKEMITKSEKAIKTNAAAQIKKKKEVSEQAAIAEKIKVKMKKFD